MPVDEATTSSTDARAEGSTGRAAGPWLVLVVACAAEFMVVLDASVVNVALPAIQAGLGVDSTGLQWVVTSYALVFAGFLLLGGRLADLYGRRRVFLAGLVVFTAASVAGGLAVSSGMLVISRGVQALGAAVLAPASLTILTTTFTEGPRRVRALAIWTALASAGGAAGSLLGGVLTEYLTWRSTLLINLPIGAIALLIAVRALPGDQHRARTLPGRANADGSGPARRLDVPGALSATVGLVALTFAVSGAPERGWSSAVTVAALAVSVVGLAVFVADEAWWSPAPLVPLRLFRLRAITVGNIAMLLAGVSLMPMWYFLSLYMQQDLGLSALATGLGFLPHTLITVVVGAWLAPRLMARIPARTLLAAGSLLAAAGFWWQSRIEPSDTYLSAVLGPAVVMSIGGGLLNTPLTTLVTSGVTPDDAGAASGLMNTTKQVGGALGLATLLTIGATSAPTGPGGEPAGLVHGFSTAFAVMAVLMIAVAMLATGLPRPERRPTPTSDRASSPGGRG